jgi:ankyrin repeat protein
MSSPHDSKTLNAQLCERIIQLEQQNALLNDENSVLRDSIKIFQTLLDKQDQGVKDSTNKPITPPDAEGPAPRLRVVDCGPGVCLALNGRGNSAVSSSLAQVQAEDTVETKKTTETQETQETKETKVSIAIKDITSSLGEDALMVGTLNYLTALVKCVSVSKAKRAAAAKQHQKDMKERAASAAASAASEKFGGQPVSIPGSIGIGVGIGREEALEDTLRHVFADALLYLSECLIEPESFISQEIAGHYSSFIEEGVDGKKAKAAIESEMSTRDFVHPDRGVRHPITWLLDQFPVLPNPKFKDNEGTKVVDYDFKDWLPLYWAVATDGDEVLDVETLLEQYGCKDYSALSPPPLLLAISKRSPSIEVSTTLTSYFGKSDDADSSDNDAGSSEATVDEKNVDEKNVDIVSPVAADGTSPLMLAAAYNDSNDLFLTLQEMFPEALRSPDKRGWRAIHYAALKGSLLNIRHIIEKYPKSVSAVTQSGCLPLHLAAQNHREKRGENDEEGEEEEGKDEVLLILSEIFNSNPGAISVADERGALPLHLAAYSGTLESVQFLRQTYPKAMEVKDRDGLLPIHYAGRRPDRFNDKIDILRYLASHG